MSGEELSGPGVGFLLTGLIERGRRRGHVTRGDVLEFFPDPEENLLETVSEALESAGILFVEDDAIIELTDEHGSEEIKEVEKDIQFVDDRVIEPTDEVLLVEEETDEEKEEDVETQDEEFLAGEKPEDTGIVPADDVERAISPELIERYGSEKGVLAALGFLTPRLDGSLPARGSTRLLTGLVRRGTRVEFRSVMTGIIGDLIRMYKGGKIGIGVLRIRINKLLLFDSHADCNEIRLAIETLGDDALLIYEALSIGALMKLGKPDLDYCSVERLVKYVRRLASPVAYQKAKIDSLIKGGFAVSDSLALKYTIPRRDLREVVGVVIDRFEDGELVDDDDESSDILAEVAQALINEDDEIPAYVEEALKDLVKKCNSDSAKLLLDSLKREVQARLYG